MNMPSKAVILDTSHSPYSLLKPVPLTDVYLEEGFWKTKYTINQNITIPSQYQQLEKTGRLDNFKRVSGEVQKPFQGYVFNDSDVYKWLEAAAWSMAYEKESEISNWIDQVISIISKAQDKDGYLNTYFSLEKIRERWTNLQEKHELYCAGHLIQAAIAHHRVLGNYRLLNVALRFADHICRTFGRTEVEGTGGHPEIEMALVELYRTTGETKYLDQAEVFIERRGQGLLGNSEYLLDHLPFTKMEHLAGHAVRALYLCCGVTDVNLETGIGELKQALQRLWNNMTSQQMYVSGGVGARHEGEALGLPYELPNARAYAESCAAIANVMWNWRLLHGEGDARYADLMEWALYNAVLPGVSIEGRDYFYINPLKDDGSHRREAWFECACCPPNIARTIAAFPGYLYSVSEAGIWINHFAQSRANIELKTGTRVKMHLSTKYPYEGRVNINIDDINPTELSDQTSASHDQFSIFIRIPGWLDTKNASVIINGQPFIHYAGSGTYLELQRQWKAGDSIDLNLLMEVRFLESHPLVEENFKRVALSRGPLLYCLESTDNPQVNLFEIKLNPFLPIEGEYTSDGLSGVFRLHMRGSSHPIDPDWKHHLYMPYRSPSTRTIYDIIDLIAIPYFAWANRSPGQMQIWHAVE
jgi:uncharacterized protein